MKSIAEWCAEIHEWAESKGWWSRPTDHVAGKLLLIHSEVAEAAEEMRDAGPCPHGAADVDYDDLRKVSVREGKPVGFPTELADIVIRVMDLCAQLGIDLEKEIARKMEYNRTREFRHGGKSL